MQVPQGRYKQIVLPVVDSDGAVVTNLADATDVTFEAKYGKSDSTAAMSISTGDQVEINTPATGSIRITFLPADTSGLTLGKFFMECQVTYSATDKRTVWMKEDGIIIDQFDLVEMVI